jgi:hypothetical protein
MKKNKTSFLFFAFFISTLFLHSQVVILKYMDYSILTSIKVRGYNFYQQEIKTIVFTDSISFNEIDNHFVKLQYCDTCSIHFPDVRRQIIIQYSDESYKTLSYDMFYMELNGKTVVFDKQLYDMIENTILQYEKKNKRKKTMKK